MSRKGVSRQKPRPAATRDGRAAPPRVTPAPAAPAGSRPWPITRFVPATLGVVLVLFGLAGFGSDDPTCRWSLAGAGAILTAWNARLLVHPAQRARGLIVDVDLRKQHYLQACAHSTIFLYWGWHLGRAVVADHAPLILVQLVFAYAFDMLLSWSRRGRYTFGFGPFPIIFSTNLFLWFKPEWFYLQLVMVAVGFAAKELIRWQRDGRLVHVFNPSSFPLAIASIGLILTHNTNISDGALIASSQSFPPHMHLLLFLVALPGQILFGVASMTASAVLTTYALGRIYLAATGTYFFLDCYLPIPVFLGMHLLFTDPSTAPRTELGRIIFGITYGVTTFLLYQLLLSAGAPSFYDKLLQVPLMNLSVRFIDRMVRSSWLRRLNPERIAPRAAPRRRYLVYTAIWATAFTTLMLTRGLGDRHPGQYLPFWTAACERGNDRACAYVGVVEQQMCDGGSGWACNEAAILGPRSSSGFVSNMSPQRRAAAFHYGCQLGFDAACRNGARLTDAHVELEHEPPTLLDYPIVLGNRMGPATAGSPAELYALACDQGWTAACGQPAEPPRSH